MKIKIFPYVVSLFFFGMCLYIFIPVLNWGFYGLPVLSIIALSLALMLSASTEKTKTPAKGPVALFIMIVLILCYVVLTPILTSWSFFHAERYRNLIGEVKIGESFAKDVTPISLDKIRIVDQELAHRLGDKVLGSQPSLGSQTYLGDFRIQKYNDEYVWVAPLLHSGFFKWWSNREGTPGYVIVSATNERDVRLVQSLDNKPIKIKYQPSAFGSELLERHVYLHGYLTKGITDFTFEINDEGVPFWVVTLFERKVGFHGSDATGIVVVNAETGEIKEYSIEDAPKWVDRIQPKSFIEDQLNDWGEFSHGWWNPSNEDKLTTTDGMSLVYDQNNRSYWFTGLTSVGSDEGTVGFVLVDTRTKETIWYKQIGATEDAAMNSAMGKVQEKRYHASFPLTYNISGVPTYVMALKDQAGLIKMVGMVSVQDYSIVAVGNDINETVRNYKNALNGSGNMISPETTSKRFKIESTIERISTDLKGGNSFYYFRLKDFPNKIFIATSAISEEIPISVIGDTVQIFYDDGKTKVVDVISFDNKQIHTEISSSAEIKTP